MLVTKIFSRKRSTSVLPHKCDDYRFHVRFHRPIRHSSPDEKDSSEKKKFLPLTFDPMICAQNGNVMCLSLPSNGIEEDFKNELGHRKSILSEDQEEKDKELIFEHRKKLLCALNENVHPFEDETFPPTSQSIYINGISFSSSTISLFSEENSRWNDGTIPWGISSSSIIWLRPQQIRSSSHSDRNDHRPWTVFQDPNPNDVIQGALGDCWFITALSVLAERPEYLMKILITKEYNDQGIYYLRLCHNGQWTKVLVDDRFPCRKDRRLIFSQSRRKQLWVPLIEKALAKLNGSYESIVAGRCCEGLSMVSGCPCETLHLGTMANPEDKCVDEDLLWKRLIDARRKEYLLCAMCANKNISKEDFTRDGLLNNHAYSLQDLQEIPSRSVKLRNPWGKDRKSPDGNTKNVNEFDEEKKKKKKKKNESNGVFWLPFSLFVKYFESVDICKIRPNWYEMRDDGRFHFQSSMIDGFRMDLKEGTDIDLTIYRVIEKNRRFERRDSILSISVVNIEKQSNGHDRIYSIPIVSERGQHKFLSTSGYLPSGLYYILPILFNPFDHSLEEQSFNLAIHSSSPIDLQRCSFPKRIEREYLIKLCLFYGEEVSKMTNSTLFDDHVRVYELKKYWDGLILLVENVNPTKYLHFHFHCSLSQNMNFSRKDSKHSVDDVIPAMHRQIIIVCSRKNPSHSSTIAHQINWELSSQPVLKHPHLSKYDHWPLILHSNDIHLPQKITSFRRN